MKVKIAGPGAGKTTNLASEIMNAHNEYDNNIYCVSFTNSSTETIHNKLNTYYYNKIPNNIFISTIHSFLNSELIQPFNYFLYEKDYHTIVNFELPYKYSYKKSRLKSLREKGILHVEEIPRVAKNILVDKSTDGKAIKEKRKTIKNIIRNYFSIVFVDEAQDINGDFMLILNELFNIGIEINLIGDVNQDLSGKEILKSLIEKLNLSPQFLNKNHRCPSNHIEFSNQFINKNQHQYSPTDKKGYINFAFQDDIINVKDYVESYDLAYIYQKNDCFNTQRGQQRDNTFNELRLIYEKRLPQENKKTQISKACSKHAVTLFNDVVNNGVEIRKAINKIFPYGKIENFEFMRLVDALTKDVDYFNSDGSVINVRSIHNIKGLEEEKCLFIITNALMPYLLKEKFSTKMNSLLYVGLTRSYSELTLLFAEEAIKKYGKDGIREIFDFFE